MNSATAPYHLPPAPGRGPAIALALLMHALLLSLLWVGVSWQSVTPIAVEAEIWSPSARLAAPPPEPLPPPEPKLAPEPPAKVLPPPVVEPSPARVSEPDIALEKKRKEQEDKQAKEQLKREADKERKQVEEEKRVEEKKRAEEQKRQQNEAAALNKQKQIEEQLRKQADSMSEQDNKKRREEDLKRLQAQAGDGALGEAEKASSPRASAGYAQLIAAKIKAATIMPPMTEILSNQPVEYAIDLLPDGSVRSVKLLRSGGSPAFDAAVRRAIERAAPYPPDPASGKVPTSIAVAHRPRDP